MDKRQLRQEVQTLRSLIKTTRTNILRKLVRDRQLWSSKLSGTTVNKRAKKKFESVEALTNHLRSLKTNQLVKDVLRYQPPSKEAQVESGSISYRALRRFRADKKLGLFLQALERQYGLGEKNAALLLINKKRKAEKKEKTPKDLKKSKDEKDQKKTKRTKPSEDKGKEQMPVKKQKETDIDEDSEEEEQSELDLSADESDSMVNSEDDSFSLDKPEISLHQKAIEKSTNRSAKQNSKHTSATSLTDYTFPEDEDDELGTEYVTDSFFVTETGSSYVAVAPKLVQNEEDGQENEEEDEQENEEEDEPWKLSNKRKIKQKHQEDQFEKQEIHFRHSSSMPEPEADLHPSWAAKQRQKVILPFVGKKVVFGEEDSDPISNEKSTEDLHPSWAAKQAQKGIRPFAGKKMVFDEDDTSFNHTKPTSTDELHPSWAAKQAQKGLKPFTGKKRVFDADDELPSVRPSSFTKPENDLHPSWAAKQAQKGIKPFEGKKVIFGANDEGSLVKPVSVSKPKSNLHPSWAAKQAQKGLKPFAGKKKVFDGNDETSSVQQATFPEAQSDLHPSWVAKQAQKGLKPFAGKKTVFDANDESPSARSSSSYKPESGLHPSWAAKQAQKGIKPFAGKKISFDEVEKDGERNNSFSKAKSVTAGLHPSWAAKQAQKGIKTFAGTKKTFGEEGEELTDRSNRVKSFGDRNGSFRRDNGSVSRANGTASRPQSSSSDLHPSWAAKQAQKGIKPFAGTKINFDN